MYSGNIFFVFIFRPDRTSTTPKNLGSLQGYARTSEGSRLSTWIGKKYALK